MKCTNTYNPITFEESVELLPDDTRKPLQELIKLYNIIEIEHLGQGETYDDRGCIHSTIYYLNCEKLINTKQKYNLKLLVEHKETKQRSEKLFKI
jgi:hypothetical protein